MTVVSHPRRWRKTVKQPSIILCATHRKQRRMFLQIRRVNSMPICHTPNKVAMVEMGKLKLFKIACGVRV